MRAKNQSSEGTQSPFLSLLSVFLLLVVAVPILGSVALADTTQDTTKDALENPLDNQVNTGEPIQNDIGNGQIFYSHSAESQITVGGDESEVFRVLRADLSATRVVENKSVTLTLVVSNTGVETKEEFLNIVSTPSSSVSVQPTNNFASVEPGSQKRFSYRIYLYDEGDYTIGVSNTNVQKEIEVVNKSSTVYEGNVKSSVERQSVSKVISSFKDELDNVNQPAYNPSIPPVVETSNGQFANSGIGRIFDFGSAQTNSNDAALTIVGNDTQGELLVGTAFENVPSQNHYTVQLNYDINPDTSVPTEDRNVELQVVSQDGSIIDKDTKYLLDANTSSTGKETRYFSLSKEEVEYVQNNKNIYLVYTSDSSPEIDVYYKRLISSNKILDTTSGRTEVTQLETHAQTQVGGPIETDFGVYEPITIQVWKKNFGSRVVERDVLLEQDGRTIASQEITLNPGEEEKVTFVKYLDTGYYTFTSENYGATQVTVGSPTGDGNEAPVARIETDLTRINNKYVPTGETAADDTSEVFELDGSVSSDANGDPLSYSWRIDGTEVSTNPTLSSSQFTTAGTKQVELVVSDGTESSVARMNVGINDINPTAQFTARPSSAPLGTSVQFDGSDAQDADGNILTYEWSIDGTTVQSSSDPFFDYTFNTLGIKSVTLRTVDDDGNVNTRTQNIEVYEADITATFNATPEPPRVNGDTVFDATNSSVVDGTIEEYRWFNDTSDEQIGTGSTITHQFNSQGTQTVRLEITTSDGATAKTSQTFDVQPPFTAGATSDVQEAEVGETFYFNSYDTTDPENMIESYEWNTDDGNTFTGQEIFHAFEEPGTYDVTLTVYGGGYSDTDTVQVEVVSSPPDALAQYDQVGFLSQQVQVFGDESTQTGGYITGYYWEFGDGYTTNGDIASHTYANPTNNTDTQTTLRDPYTITLTVTGQYGLTDTDTVEAEIRNRGPYNDYTIDVNGDERNEDTSSDYEGWISSDYTLNGTQSYHYENPVGTIEVYRWEITRPDGTTFIRNGEQPVQNFDQIGEYEVKYSIRDEWNYWNNTTFTIDIDARPPKASFVYSPQEPGPSEPVDYDAASSEHNEPEGNIQSYDWNFGDGTGNETGETVTHVFSGSTSQTYTATLTVTDQWGQTDTVTKTITTDPYQSCHDLLINRENAQSGNYPIDPDDDGDGTFEVYCNMDYDGGGWTVIDKQAMSQFGQDVGSNVRTNGDIQQWNAGPNDVYSVDGGGDHSFVYSAETGFIYKELRIVNYKLGAASYRVNGATSEMRGSNTALSDWDGLNSGGVSGDGGFGTANSVLDSYNNAHSSGDCPDDHGWPTCGQFTGDSGINYPTDGTPEFWDNGDTYQVEASSVAVGWGESGGQEEGWEWEKGEFWVRQPTGTLIYFYDNGNNIKNYQQQSIDSGSVNFQSNQVDLHSNNGETTIRNTDNINLSRYNEVYIDYILTNQDGGDGYVELNANGRTARDTINNDYLVNDGSLEIDVSDLSDTSANIDVTAGASGSDTTVEVQRVWGREGGASTTTTVYNEQFNGGTDGWTTSSSNGLETTNGWLRLQCSTGYNTGSVRKTFDTSIDADSINYEVSFSASDSWDDEDTLSLQFRDDSGWNTVNTANATWEENGNTGDTVYDCTDGEYSSVEYTWSGSFNVNGQVTDTRFVLNKNQDDYDEGFAIDYITIERQ